MLTRLACRPIVAGVVIGALFGTINLVVTWLDPLVDDNPATLLGFYGPMFLLWALAGFGATRQTSRISSGVATGALVAFATFCAFDLFILLRVNLFFDDLTQRADWQNMIARFHASGDSSLRTFVNVDYLEGAPFKGAVSTAIGAIMGILGGAAGRFLDSVVDRNKNARQAVPR